MVDSHPSCGHVDILLPGGRMSELPSQLAQELLHSIISFLSDSPADWPACALVSRSWVYPAQSHIFRRLSLKSVEDKHRLAQFLVTMEISPHLLRHVHQLHLGYHVSTETFLRVCNFSFTHLDLATVTVHMNSTTAPALQQLLSTPTSAGRELLAI